MGLDLCTNRIYCACSFLRSLFGVFKVVLPADDLHMSKHLVI